MTLELFRIQSDDFSTREINRIAKLFPDTGKILEEKRIKVINKMATLALDAARTKVPIDTGELRNTHLIKGKLANRYSLDATIIVQFKTHYGRKRSPYAASLLALILDNGYHHKGTAFKRSKESEFSGESSLSNFQTIEKGAETQGWIDKAQSAFRSKLRSVIIG